jgi:hypothetical protein
LAALLVEEKEFAAHGPHVRSVVAVGGAVTKRPGAQLGCGLHCACPSWSWNSVAPLQGLHVVRDSSKVPFGHLLHGVAASGLTLPAAQLWHSLLLLGVGALNCSCPAPHIVRFLQAVFPRSSWYNPSELSHAVQAVVSEPILASRVPGGQAEQILALRKAPSTQRHWRSVVAVGAADCTEFGRRLQFVTLSHWAVVLLKNCSPSVQFSAVVSRRRRPLGSQTRSLEVVGAAV